jgi:hypothetical protein
MVLATDDTSISVPHEKYFPGSQALYEEYIAALDKDFKSHGGSVGFVAKGLATEFIGGESGEGGHVVHAGGENEEANHHLARRRPMDASERQGSRGTMQ